MGALVTTSLTKGQLRRPASKFKAAVVAVALATLPVHGHAQSQGESCSNLAVVGHQIAEWRDGGIPPDAVKAAAEALSFREHDRSALAAFRELVDLIYGHPDADPSYVQGALLALCMSQ